MIARIEVLGYRCLRYVSQDLNRFHVLVGPNASGKSAFLDALTLMSDVVFYGLHEALATRSETEDFRDLVWMRNGNRFEIAVEVSVPPERREKLKNGGYTGARYELAVGSNEEAQEPTILAETFWLTGERRSASNGADGLRESQRTMFPQPPTPPETILVRKPPRSWRKTVNKVAESGNDYFSSETSGWNNLFRLGPHKSALANLPEDDTKFPIATWFKELLMVGVQQLTLNSERMRRPSPPRAPKTILPDGSTLPLVVETLATKYNKRFEDWLRHVKTALPDLKTIRSVERSDDRHRYLVLEYENGLKVPSWLASDGTLRLLALTLLAYLPDSEGVFLIEEAENGIHPRAVETVFQSLSSVYGAQVLLATHSPVILSIAEPSQVLCFAKTTEGATDIVRGSEHPRLKEWKHEIDMGTLLASGVLG